MKFHAGLAVALSLSTSIVAHAADTLYVGGAGGTKEKAFKEKIIPGFKAKTGVDVVYVAGNSTDLLAKLKAQKGRQEMSVAMIDDGPMYQAVEQGLCAPLQIEGSVKDVYPGARMSGDKSIGLGFLATGIAYNKAVFEKNGWAAPTSWNDLADPKYKQKVVIPPITNGYGLHSLIMASRLHGGDEKNMNPGFEYFKQKVAPNVLSWEPSPGKMAEQLQTGEAAIAVWGNGRVQAVIDQGAPVAFVYPKEGGVILMNAGCVVEGAPQPKVAQQFIQYILTPEVQAILAASDGMGPVNPKTVLPPKVAAQVVFGPEKVNALKSMDYTVINQQRAAWTQRWNREIER